MSISKIILLAEDDANTRLAMSALLQRLGCKVDTATNGIEAVMRARSGPYGVILMDIRMPEMDGLEATKEIRRTNPTVPIVALTADHSRIQCLEVGMTEYLAKPVSAEDLKTMLGRWL